MNVDRMHAVANGILAETSAQKLIVHMTALRDSLTQLAQNPADGNAQGNLSTSRQSLSSHLSQAGSDRWSQADRAAIDELGMTGLLGERLLEQIEAVLTRNEMTPTVAAGEIGPLVSRLDERLGALRALADAYKTLGVGSAQLDGSAEVLVVIPGPSVDRELAKLGKECQRVSHILGAFQELTTNSQEPVHVNALASSDFTLFLDADSQWAAPLARSLARIADTYVSIQSIRDHIEELQEDEGVPSASLTGLRDYANSSMDRVLEELTNELMAQYSNVIGATRPAEFRLVLRAALNGLANRVDQGYGFDVRAPDPSDEPLIDDDQSDTPSSAADMRIRQELIEIRDSGVRIRHFPAPMTRMLELSESGLNGDGAQPTL